MPHLLSCQHVISSIRGSFHDPASLYKGIPSAIYRFDGATFTMRSPQRSCSRSHPLETQGLFALLSSADTLDKFLPLAGK
ncbi:hypothetical protein E2C01_035676 [Portunus trituberculatus]|uniref:Uncharacterized protein n=1 Tax=Portunus trituberculatus TaxID=210409 RepID=A0A5B7FC38_PORTR|nr:hypothetical protein [Portunus trituberculatus]